MIEFLIKRPIAVIMAFLAFTLIGLSSLRVMPITLMPEIDIPHLKIQINEPNYSSSELENLIVNPIRRQLLQVSRLDNLKSKTSNGKAVIDLNFEYGIDIDYAFIEVNENLDKVMSSFPKEVSRPTLIKSSSLDIPLFFVNIPYPNNESKVDFSNYINNTVKKRLEQNKSISYVDITGLVFPEIVISPNLNTLEKLNISIRDIENTIIENNSQLGSFKIKDGHYVLDVLFEPTLRDIESIKNLSVKTEDGSYEIKKLAKVSLKSRERKGYFYNNQKEALSLAVFSKKNIKIHETKNKVISYLEQLKEDNPDLSYFISEDQTDLLKLSINNLFYSILSGTILAILIVFIFIRTYKLSLIIGTVIPISLIISIVFLHILGITINVVSLSGFIVGIGMMIDNSLIVIDNITQYRVKGDTFLESCSKGVYEIIKPLLSSLLTTCVVFIPLIYLKGISGVLFYDQAISIIISLTVSYLTSIILLPTLYTLLKIEPNSIVSNTFNKSYLNSFDFFFKRKNIMILSSFIVLAMGVFFVVIIDKQKLPNIRYNNFNLIVDWNEPISIKDNLKRTLELEKVLENPNSKYIGEQDFFTPVKGYLTSGESSLFIKSKSYEESQKVKENVNLFLNNNYNNSIFTISNSKNLFEQIFPKEEVNLLARVPANYELDIDLLINDINVKFPKTKITVEQEINYIKIEIDINKLSIYKVDVKALLAKLKSILGDNKISILKTTNEYLPIVIRNNNENKLSNIENLHIDNRESVKIPLRSLISIKHHKQRGNLYANMDGNYIPLIIDTKREEEVIAFMKNKIGINLGFEGKYFENKDFIKQLSIILIIVVFLLYFILAAQFESLVLPLIILSEIPLTLSASIIILQFIGISLNIMSMIGLIIILGIVINDSILKIDAINKSRFVLNMSIKEAIHNAGKKRLNAILMTSLTTIFAMVPIFFSSGMGYDLQKPFAFVVIISMIVGTVVSIYYVPIVYWFLAKKNRK